MPSAAPNPAPQNPEESPAKPALDPARRALRASLVLTAWMAGAFCALVCATMLYLQFTGTTNDPWKSPQLLALKARLEAEPAN